MDVKFVEAKAAASEADIVIIVAGKQNGTGFVKSKLESLFGRETAKLIAVLESDLAYAKIKGFKLAAQSGRLVEVLIAGAGESAKITRASTEKLGGYVFSHISAENATVSVQNNIESELKQAAAYLASGIALKAWEFDKYKAEKAKVKVKSLECQTCFSEVNKELYSSLDAIKSGVFTTREMVTEPANVMNPDKMLEIAKTLKKCGVKVSVLDKKDMERRKMHAILGVGQGSANPTYIVVMEYCTNSKLDKIALIGKGLTFDSGGISIKPSNKMGEMKGDMAGAAAVVGAVKALALQKAAANVVGIIGVAENMPSGSAQRPGDVVTAMSGKTIEVDNTDAEGRLVLADVLWYAHLEHKPAAMVDLATLTGAIEIALGHEFAGLFTGSDVLARHLEAAAETVGEKLWRLPLHPSFADDIKSNIADIKNVGAGRGAGSITAAMFLKEFVPDSIEWAHLDIAAVEWDSVNRALSQKGATGFGVRLLCDFVRRYYGG